MSAGAPVLEVRGVTKAFGDREVLRGVDLTVSEHQAVALIGASGSGKSTLLRCIDLLEEIDDGDVFLDGEVVTDPSVEPVPVRRRLGLVFQAFNLFPHLTVLQNVVLGEMRAMGASRSEAEDHGRALLSRFGLEGREDDRPDDLSGGQQQRVAIARAFAGRPRALLLDEVTSALDPELVGEVLRSRARSQGGGDDDGHRHPRDGLRARGRRRGRVPPRRADRRVGPARPGPDALRSARRRGDSWRGCSRPAGSDQPVAILGGSPVSRR